MKLEQAAAELAKFADRNTSMTFSFDTMYEGQVHLEWMTCLQMTVTPKDLPAVVEAMLLLEKLEIETL